MNVVSQSPIRVLSLVLVTLWTVTACSAHRARPEDDPDAALGFDGSMSVEGGLDANVDATIDANDGAVPTECDLRFDALPDACESDDDCFVVWQHACMGNGARGRALGVSRSAQAAAQQVGDACVLTLASPNCDPRAYEFMLAPYRADDGRTSLLGDAEVSVRCERNRCNTYVSSCGPDFCGNGTIDECLAMYSDFGTQFVPRPHDGTAPVPSDVAALKVEACDGANLNQQSCESIGYGDGVLGCQPLACHFDVSQCKACVPPAGMVTACAEDVAGSAIFPPAYAIGVSETATLIATARETGDAPVIEITRFDASLVEVGHQVLTRDVLGEAPLARYGTLELAPRPGGWLLAWTVDGDAGRELRLDALHADGSYERALGRVAGVNNARIVLSDGAPRWLVSDDLRAFGTFEVRRFDSTLALSEPTAINGLAVVDAIAVGDALLVAFNAAQTLQVQRVEADGATIEPPHAHDGAVVRSVLLVLDTVPLLLTWGSQTTLAQLGADGARTGDPIVVAANIDGYDVRATGWSDGVIVAHRSVAGRSVGVMHVALDGSVSRRTDVLRHPDVIVPRTLQPQGDHLVLGTSRWPEGAIGGWLQLARLQP